MNENNIIAEAMERAGLRTFSSNEMAFNILGLMHPQMVRVSEEEPVYGDLNGGLDVIKNLAQFTKDIRQKMTDGAQIRRALAKERLLEASLEVNPVERVPTVKPRANMEFKYPKLSTVKTDKMFADMLDLSHVVVVTGFSEVGPWGNSRTRWEMEAEGEFSLEGCIEMAWMMGLVKYHNGVDTKGKPYTGWVDVRSGESVQDYDIKLKYEKQILEHSGIRFVEPELFDGYDPNKKQLSQEIVIDYDMAPFEASKEEADQFKLRHGELVDIYPIENGSWNIRLRRGAVIHVPKALRFDRLVAGQIPTGWDAERYGVPKDIVQQVDPITLYTIVSTVEALVSAGITDPYEFYQYVHVSEVGNTSGGGEGGMVSNRGIFLNRFIDKPTQSDVLQECFINTMPAWVNLLLLSSSGPIKTPVGACATAVESVEIGVQTILDGKARVMIVGGYDDFQEESSYEFAQMKATSNAVDEIAKGRQPDEMSRPTTTSRGGFMESQGSGIQILMTAELALQMGCPIYGIVALTNTATDKEGRSIPAPGQGILTTARSVRPLGYKPRILDIKYRHAQLMKAQQRIKEWFADEVQLLHEEAKMIEDETERKLFMSSRSKDIELECVQREKNEKILWGFDFWKQDSRISPIEGALAVYGLDIDDIGVASFHGTGTKANDLNESEVVNKQLKHLGRSKGNLLPCVFQKYLTGHPKGAAAAWMLNGYD
jgi:fatty acid synthase subunit beta